MTLTLTLLGVYLLLFILVMVVPDAMASKVLPEQEARKRVQDTYRALTKELDALETRIGEAERTWLKGYIK